MSQPRVSSDTVFAGDFVNGGVSFWARQEGLGLSRPPLSGDLSVDVVIVGGGLTGLWSAFYLKQARPELEIAVLEKHFVGFGASGRNGGWLSALVPGKFSTYARVGGVAAAQAFEREMISAVGEVVATAQQQGFGDDVAHEGFVRVATNAAQLQRLEKTVAAMRAHGWGADDVELLTGAAATERIRVAGAVGAFYSPHCARIHPARFTAGLARAVEALGCIIYEDTAVTAVEPHAVVTSRGRVSARFVVQALEGYTCSLAGQSRRLLPMNSSMVVTEQIAPEVLAEIWPGAELLGDVAHNFAYVQRTADNRIALGGRGVPYQWANGFAPGGETALRAVRQLGARIRELFPQLAGVRLAHAWSGVLGVPRDWCAGVRMDAASGVVAAGGYVGHGVTGTNVAGRTVRDLILGEDSVLTRLPWVGHGSRLWEPEPLRFVGARALYAAYRFADRLEYGLGFKHTCLIAQAADAVSGRS